VVVKDIVFGHGFQDVDFDPKEKGQAAENYLKKYGWRLHSLSYSEGKPTRQPLDIAVTKLVEKIDELGLKKIYGGIGHSMGGYVICDLARSYRNFGIKVAIMEETPIMGLPPWLLRLWRFFSQRQADYSWGSIQDMREGSDYITRLNKDWPSDILRFEIAGSLSQKLKRFYKLPKDIPVTVFPRVGHSELRDDPAVLDHIVRILECSTIQGYYR